MRLILFCSILSILTFSCNTKDQRRIIQVDDHGIFPNTKQNCTPKINQLLNEISHEPVTIIFPKGRYNFFPDSNYFKTYFESNTYDVNPKRLAILIEGKKNIIIDARGSDFVYHDHIQPFTLDNSNNITLKNVNIDWDKPLTAESEVIEADSKHIKIKIDTSQFHYSVEEKGLIFSGTDWKSNWRLSGGSWLIEYNKEHIIPPFTGDHGCVNGDLENVTYSENEPGIITMKGSFTKTPTVGNFLIMRYGTRDHSGIFLFHSQNITLKNINVYHTSGLGILSQYCENITMRNVNIIPNPQKNRYLSSHDDGLHFMGCKGKIIIDSCDAQGLMDDPINIHGTCVPVVKRVDDLTVKCKFAHSMSSGLIWAQKGDTVGFIEKRSMTTISHGIIKKFDPINKDSFLLEFEHLVPFPIDHDYSIENLSWTPDVTITNCFAGSCRARGYLISTPGKVIIENNIFETSGSAILIAGDANYWFESGAVTDVSIRNNIFRWPCNSSSYQFCHAIISIFPEIPEPDTMAPFHKNITIENNVFNPSDYPVLYARSVDGLIFRSNTITRNYSFEPWHPIKHTFTLEACKNVEIRDNTIGKDVLGQDIMLRNMQLEELLLHNDTLKIIYR